MALDKKEQGFHDAYIACVLPQSEDTSYLSGYGRGYEMAERESALQSEAVPELQA